MAAPSPCAEGEAPPAAGAAGELGELPKADACEPTPAAPGDVTPIWTNPTSASSPAKLRMVFEAVPVALLVEAAGGASSDGVSGGSVLDVEITSVSFEGESKF